VEKGPKSDFFSIEDRFLKYLLLKLYYFGLLGNVIIFSKKQENF